MRVSTVVAVVVLLLIGLLVLYGASLQSGGGEGEDGFEGGSRLLLVAGAGAFLAFVLGYAVRDVMGKRSAAARRRAGR